MTRTASTLSLRADLIRRRVWMGSQPFWVLKDPLSRAFFYFSDREYTILRLLDGRRSVAELVAECSQRFAPDFLSAESLIGFLADARRKGLLVSPTAKPMKSEVHANRKRWWHQPLAIRFPGINPDRLLDALEPLCRPLLSPVAAAIASCLVAAAAMVAVTQFTELNEHIAVATNRSAAGGLIVLMLVISITKIIHEFAHALVCKHFGGEVREMGVMLLVGIPCLYCDVSDAWLLPQRWKRILVSAAGMMAELVLAAIATCFWLITVDGTVRDVCVTIMLVCSISTLVFNGNPLLRYDGYFILSDLLGVPNLANESTTLVRGWLRRVLWSGPRPPRSEKACSAADWFLACYAIASGFYRLTIYAVILTVFYALASSHEFSSLAAVVAISAVAAVIVRSLKPVLAAPSRSVRRPWMTSRRPALIVSAVGIVLLFASLIPLPRSIIAPMSMQPAAAQEVFISLPGRIETSLTNGSQVTEGQMIASLRDVELEQELLRLANEIQLLETELESVRQRRTVDRDAAGLIPSLSKALTAARNRMQLRESESDRLTVRAPRGGRIFAPLDRPAVPNDRADVQQTWIGTPLSPENQDAWLSEGTVLCLVGDDIRREALLLVRQQDVELVRSGAKVTFLLPEFSRGTLTGTIGEVSASPVDEISTEFTASGLIRRASGSRPGEDIEGTYYQVRAALDHPLNRDENEIAIPVRTIGHARISVRPASLSERLFRFIAQTFQSPS